MVNPIRDAISEEVEIFVQNWNRVILSDDKINAKVEFKDALEHNISKVVDLIVKERHEHIYNHAQNEVSKELKTVKEMLATAKEDLAHSKERNGRLHEEIKKREEREKTLNRKITQLSKQVELYEGKLYNPLVVYQDDKMKVDFFKDPLIKHLEEEIAFLRTLVTQNIINK